MPTDRLALQRHHYSFTSCEERVIMLNQLHTNCVFKIPTEEVLNEIQTFVFLQKSGLKQQLFLKNNHSQKYIF